MEGIVKSLLVTIAVLVLVNVPVIADLTSAELEIFRTNGVSVTGSGNNWLLEHHGVPEHGFDGGFGNNPNDVTVQNHSFLVPKVSTVLTGDKGCVRLGSIGMSISGAPFYNPYTGQGNNAVEGHCSETFDQCSGHPGGNGLYHYHKLPACLYTGTDLKDKFLGVAFDGYPIYGPMDDTGKNWTTKELDPCHGHMYNGTYRYRITHQFPYILGCFHGSTVQRNQQPLRPSRQQRDTLLQRYTRQNRICLFEEASDWKQKTCYAFCTKPSDGSYDNCDPESTIDTSTTPTITSTDEVSSGTLKTVSNVVFFSSVCVFLITTRR